MNRHARCAAILTAALATAAPPSAAHGTGEAVLQTRVIVHPALPVLQLDESLLWAVFSMRLARWPDGQAVRVFVLPDEHPAHRAFAHEYLGTHPYVLRRLWTGLAATGTGRPPIEVPDPGAMRAAVAATAGAIGYLPADDPAP